MDQITATIIATIIARSLIIVFLFSVTFCDMDNGKNLHDILLTKIDNIK